MLAHNILRGSRDEEILLLQAKGFAFDVIIRGVKDFGDNLCHGAVFHTGNVLAFREEIHIQRINGMSVPKAESIDIVAAIACDEHVTRDSGYGSIAGIFSRIVTEVIPMRLDAPFEANFNGVLIAGNQPTVHRGTPVVGDFRLLSAAEELAENTEFIADGIACSGEAECRHTLEIAGSKTTKTTVTEAGIRFRFKNIGGIPPHILQGADQSLRNTEVEGVFHEASAEKELHRQIVDFFLMVRGILYGKKTAHQLSNDDGGSLEDLVIGGGLAGHTENSA